MTDRTRDRNVADPLPAERQEQAREIIARHLDARVRQAELAVSAAQQDLQVKLLERRQWQAAQALSGQLARELEAAANDAYTTAALEVIHDDGGTRTAAHQLRDEHRLIRAYLKSVGHDTPAGLARTP
ncbi:hypothetical protein OIE66_06285 [Nonomuraea sp. NBC_01738]|uniref:hypothetical protein n=1 Tax=Nonomuraea sp. NBC_01738 TaxID=2976003 RepID=UPI002E153977|nr:hypothetical protein OIE66_06285 [Nonomuraea sp. NBC_01738]